MIAALEPPPRLTVSEWADRNRRLSPEASAEAGEWRTDRAPYQKALLDALTPNSPYERVVLMASSQTGKCLALDTPIATPTGWSCMGELQVGDFVFDETGRPTRVTGISPVYTDHSCYRLRFDNGESIVADAGHRWPVYDAECDVGLITARTEEMAGTPAHRFRTAGVASILRVEPVPSVPVRCIAVDSQSHLFLAGRNRVPTHNTECLNSFVGYVIDQDPGPILVVQPRVEDGEAWSKDRLAPMLRDTPVLREKVADVRSRDANNRVLHKRFQGGSITIAGANSPAGLAMRPIRYVLLDEVDRYPPSAGTEGDPVSLAIKRSTTWWNRKILLVSSPTVKGASRIESWWLRSNQQSYWVPCPQCNGYQVLVWPNLIWPKGHPEEARYRCEHCGEMLASYRKPWMLARGEWRAANPKSKIAGFWINQLYSPWREWPETAIEGVEARHGGPETWRAFINTALGELWDDEAETSVDIAALLTRREPYGPRLPGNVCVLTAGIDIQLDRAELELVGWGKGEESWSIEYRVFPGDPSAPELWRAIDEYLNRQWLHEYGISLPVAACGIDSGFHTQQVYDFCRVRYHRRVFALKGKAGPLPVWPKKPTRNTINRTPLWIVGVDSAKSVIYGRLKIEQPSPGYSHFPSERPAGWFEQLLSETLVTTYSKGVPVREWRPKKGVRTEALDARVYAYAALCGLVSMGFRIDAEAERISALLPDPVGTQEKRRPASRGRTVLRSRWLDSNRKPGGVFG